jgi:DNA polymerase-3 subunit epsilon
MNIGVIDIETTGFLLDGGFIVEIGIAKLDTETGFIDSVFDARCREKGMTSKDRDAWIFKNSTLTVKEVRDAQFLSAIRGDIQGIIDSFDAVTAFNKAFDFGFLVDRGFSICCEWPCIMLTASEDMKVPKTGYSSKYPGYKLPNVMEAWAFYMAGKQYEEAHRGLDDAMHEAMIAYELFKRGLMTS